METTIHTSILKDRESILSLWQAALLSQASGLNLAGTSKTRFTVPGDYLLKEEAETLFDWLVGEEAPISARPSIREICKFKAVQGINPSEALGFLIDLKSIIRLVVGKGELSCSQHCELSEIDTRIDQLLMLAFDEYAECREKIMEIRIEEVTRLARRSAT